MAISNFSQCRATPCPMPSGDKPQTWQAEFVCDTRRCVLSYFGRKLTTMDDWHVISWRTVHLFQCFYKREFISFSTFWRQNIQKQIKKFEINYLKKKKHCCQFYLLSIDINNRDLTHNR